MPISTSSQFDLQARIPLRKYTVVLSLVARDLIPDIVRYDGFETYVVSEGETYRLQGGVTNSDWVGIINAVNEKYLSAITVNSLSDIVFTVANGTNLSMDISHGHPWSDITSTPTTEAGYGITDGFTSWDKDYNDLINKPWLYSGTNIYTSATKVGVGGIPTYVFDVVGTGRFTGNLLLDSGFGFSTAGVTNVDRILDEDNFASNSSTALATQQSIKAYVDNAVLGYEWIVATVVAATTANITIATALNDGDVLDGVTLTNGDYVLVKNQTTLSENGLYVVGVTPVRATEMDAPGEFKNKAMLVVGGTINAGSSWVCVSTVTTVGTDDVEFSKLSQSTSYTAGTGIDIGGAVISLSHLGFEDLSNPSDDRIVFWDNSASALKWLDVDASLSISGTTMSVSLTPFDTDDLSEGSTNLYTQWVTSGSDIYYNTGRVGIGNSTVNNKLQVESQNLSSIPALGASGHDFALSIVNGRGLVAGHLSDGRSYIQSQRLDGTATAYNLLLQPNGGNVGIGTTSPSQIIHIKSTTPVFNIQTSSAGTGSSPLSRKIIWSDYLDTERANINVYDYRFDTFRTEMAFTITNNSGSLSEAMRIRYDGNVGIGISSPPEKLQILNGVNTNNHSEPTLGFSSDRGDYYSAIGTNRGGDSTRIGMSFFTSDAGSLTERMTISPSGNVGIGVTSPNASYKLDVNGNIWVRNSLLVGGGNGNIGEIILTGDNGGVETGKITFSDTSTNSLDISTNYSSTSNKITFSPANSTVVTILGSGKVGIGIENPTRNLTVYNASSSVIGVSNSSNESTLQQNTNGGALQLLTNAGASNVLIRSYSDSYFTGGKVGIGTTSPSQLISISNGGHSAGIGFGYNETEKWVLRLTGTTDNIGFYDGSNYRFYIDRTTGYVGINQATPLYNLDVTGTGRFTSDLIINGNSSIIKANPVLILKNTTSETTAAARINFLGSTGSLIWQIGSGQVLGSGFEINEGTTNRVYIHKGGNISIGNNNNTYKLDVNGTGRFTGDVTIDTILNVRGAIDLADSDILRFGSSDDWEFFHDGTNNYMDLNVGDLYIRDNTTTRWSFYRTTGNFLASGTVTATNFILSSDISVKENIKQIEDKGIDNIDIISFNYKKDEEKRVRYGVIAQELEKSYPEMVYEDEEGLKQVAYIDYLLVKMNEKDKKINDLEERIEKLEKLIK